jgi:ribosome-associated protein
MKGAKLHNRKGDPVHDLNTAVSPTLVPRTIEVSRRSLELALAAAQTAEANRARDVVILDLRNLTSVFDYFVIGTGTSRRQLHAISCEIDRTLEDELGDERLGIEGYADSSWILLDYGSIVIHLFDEETRRHFALEELWAEAPRVARKSDAS